MSWLLVADSVGFSSPVAMWKNLSPGRAEASLAEAMLPLEGVTVTCAEGKELPLELATGSGRRGWGRDVLSRGVSHKSVTARVAEPADVLVERLSSWTEAAFGRSGKTRTPGSAVGQWLFEDTRQLAHPGGTASLLEMLGMAGKAGPAPTAALSEALGLKGPRWSSFRGGSQLDLRFPFLFTAEGPGTERVCLLVPSLPVGVSNESEAGAVEYEQELGRGFGDEEAGAPEVCFLPDSGCTEVVTAAGAKRGPGPRDSCSTMHFLFSAFLQDTVRTGDGAVLEASRERGVVLLYWGARDSPCNARLMRRNAVTFSQSRCSAVTRYPSFRGGGSSRGFRLSGSRGILRFCVLALQVVCALCLKGCICFGVVSATFSFSLCLETCGVEHRDWKPFSFRSLEVRQGS